MAANIDKRPIGVFDSGLGGLTAMAALMRLLPGEDICYLGDTGRVPYGVRSRETIQKYARQDMQFLERQNIKAAVVACGTVSAVALEQLTAEFDIPVYGVIEPAVRAALSATKTGNIGILGTEATIASGAYERQLRTARPEVTLTSVACPLFVPLVENGRVSPGDVVIETIVSEYLAPIRQSGVDTLILGCTHYPLLEAVISRFLGPSVTLISSGAAAAALVVNELTDAGLLNGQNADGIHRYFVTDSVAGFERLASLFLQQDVSGEVEQVIVG
ncbi:MAG: glutamate racemase [Oscillospiraceae bacterium]|nr:glutamate racemase [Oscillospiraceae bacterium]